MAVVHYMYFIVYCRIYFVAVMNFICIVLSSVGLI